MNEDRSQVLDLVNSDWNTWLIEEAVGLTTDLLEDQLFGAYGVDAYLATNPGNAAATTVPEFAELVASKMREEACWPSAALTPRKHRQMFARLADLSVPTDDALADFAFDSVSPNLLLAEKLVRDARSRDLAIQLGGRRFDLGHLIRFRCAGEDKSALATPSGGPEGRDIFFPDFEVGMTRLATQLSFAAALDASRAQLTDANKRDLRSTRSTLSAGGTIAALDDPLWVLPEGLTASSLPPTTVLHPALADGRVLPSLGKRFNASTWAMEVASRISAGMADEQLKGALLEYMRGDPKLSAKAWSALRRVPWLPDQYGNLAAPADLVSRRTPRSSLLAPALRFARSEDDKSQALRPLKIRSTLEGSDLVALAEMIEAGDANPDSFKAAVARLPELLTPRVLGALSGVEFLETQSSALAAPSNVYIESAATKAVVDSGTFAIGWPRATLRRLGCLSKPRTDDILAALRAHRTAGTNPTNVELRYRSLLEAARGERRSLAEGANEPIIFFDDQWLVPADCLVGEEHNAIFRGAVQVLPRQLKDEFVALGAHTKPGDRHWRALFASVAAKYASRKVSKAQAEALLRAYIRLGEPPAGLSAFTKCLLDDAGQLWSMNDASRGDLLINDDPITATAAKQAGVSVNFAEASDFRTHGFFRAAGVKGLAEVTRQDAVTYGTPVEVPPTVRSQEALTRLTQPHFVSALSALSSKLSGPHQSRTHARLLGRLRRIKDVDFVSEIHRDVRLRNAVFQTPLDFSVESDRLVFPRVTSKRSFDELLARALATIADARADGEERLSDAIYFLLGAKSPDEIRRQMERRRIPWSPDPHFQWDEALEDLEDEIVAEIVTRAVTQGGPGAGSQQSQPPPSRSAPERPTPPIERPTTPLPDLENVTLEIVSGSSQGPNRGGGGGGGGWPSNWTPRTPDQIQRDREVGRRGEELVFRMEQQRAAAAGHPTSSVVWVASQDPAANHDIKSVDEDGEDVWIEVKSTTGRDGRFTWSRAEFQLAVRTRTRYILWRVYEADTTSPKLRVMRDRVGEFEQGNLAVDLDSLAANLGPPS